MRFENGGWRRLAALGLLPFSSMVLGQSIDERAPTSNQQVIDAWRRQVGENAPIPSLVTQADGGSRLDWHGSVVLDAYRTEVDAAPDLAGTSTPLRTGSFAKAVLATDARLSHPDGQISFLRGSFLSSNDRTVVSGYPNQITNFQLGRNGPAYELSLGDTALSYSTLGSALGFRGMALSHQIENWAFSGFGGVVADSWEAMLNRVPLGDANARSRYLRDVTGAKVEATISSGLKAFLTMQAFADRTNSLPTELRTQAAATSHAFTTGLVFQNPNWLASAELAESSYAEGGSALRKGQAAIFDATYKSEQWTARAGFHDIAPFYTSLAQSIPPGIRESFIGADWNGKSWITLGADYRLSSSRSLGFAEPQAEIDPLPTPVIPPLVVTNAATTQTMAGRANFNLASILPGWGAGLQLSSSRSDDPQGNARDLETRSGSVNYSSPRWTFSLNGSAGKTASARASQYDSSTRDLHASIGRNYAVTDAKGGALWSLSLAITGGRQIQQLTETQQTASVHDTGFNLAAQWSNVGQANLHWTRSVSRQPIGGNDLQSSSLQLDATLLLGKQHSLKFYLQDVLRNAGDATLRSSEKMAGTQLNLAW